MGGQHRADMVKPGVAAWLGAGAITLGIGAALSSGAAVANASTEESGGTTSAPSATQHDGDAASANKPAATTTPKKKSRHRSDADTSGASIKTEAAEDKTEAAEDKTDADTPVARPSATTHKRSSDVDAATATAKVTSKLTPAVAAATTDTVSVPKSVVLPTSKAQNATSAPANPLVAVNHAIRSFLHNIQVQLFTPPAPKTAAATTAAATSTDFYSWFKKTFSNTLPTITVSPPTKNADGTYTGQFTASDVDGDPLTIRDPFQTGSPTTLPDQGDGPITLLNHGDGPTTVTDHGDGSYTYTYTPSATASATPNYQHTFIFAAVETNGALHFHSLTQLVDAILQATIGNLLRAFDPSLGSIVIPPYAPSNWSQSEAAVTLTIGPVAAPALT